MAIVLATTEEDPPFGIEAIPCGIKVGPVEVEVIKISKEGEVTLLVTASKRSVAIFVDAQGSVRVRNCPAGENPDL